MKVSLTKLKIEVNFKKLFIPMTLQTCQVKSFELSNIYPLKLSFKLSSGFNPQLIRSAALEIIILFTDITHYYSKVVSIMSKFGPKKDFSDNLLDIILKWCCTSSILAGDNLWE